MPVKRTTQNGKPAYKWGDSGKAYTYTAGDEASRKRAYHKALNQGYAASISSKGKYKLIAKKVSFDYDETLSTEKGTELATKLITEGNVIYIISARSNVSGMLSKALELGIPNSRIYATGSNKAKVEKIKQLGIDIHYDNNQDVINELGRIGKKF